MATSNAGLAQAIEEIAQDQGTATDESQVQAEEAAQGQGPWAKDLAEFFADEDSRATADRFIREKVQPYVTKLESEKAPEQAVALYSDLQEDPASTFLVLTEDLFGPEVAQNVVKTLAESWGETPDIEEPAVADDTDDEGADQSLDPRVAKWVQKMEADEEAQEEAEIYEQVVDALVEFDPEVDRELIDPFVAAAEGDPRQAYLAYKQWIEAVEAKLNPADESDDEEGGDATEVEEAPAVIGSDVQTPSAPPTQKQYGSMDEAVEDFLAEVRTKSSNAPGTVGSV